jgi:hypothetical protein
MTRRTLSNLLGRSHVSLRFGAHALRMTLTTIITVNAVLGAILVYALHHLLAHGLSSHRAELHELAALPDREVERLAA